MPQISATFWDVGGVLLTNAWDGAQRRLALQHFALDEAEFSDRHEMVISSFERGKITLDQYLDRTIFYRPRPFTRQAFSDYMYSLSQPHAESLAVARELAASKQCFMATVNNESRELNLYRIHTFGLHEIFDVFVSSCFVRLRKPEEGIYRLALEITQTRAEECCFIDDRPLNLESASHLGMRTIHMQNAAQLRTDLAHLGLKL